MEARLQRYSTGMNGLLPWVSVATSAVAENWPCQAVHALFSTM